MVTGNGMSRKQLSLNLDQHNVLASFCMSLVYYLILYQALLTKSN